MERPRPAFNVMSYFCTQEVKKTIIPKSCVQKQTCELPKCDFKTILIEDPTIKLPEKKKDMFAGEMFHYKYVKNPVYVEKIKHKPKIIMKEKIVEVPHYVFKNRYIENPIYINPTKIVNKPSPMIVEKVIPKLTINKNEIVFYENNETKGKMFVENKNFEKIKDGKNSIQGKIPALTTNCAYMKNDKHFINCEHNIWLEPNFNNKHAKKKKIVICDDIFKNPEIFNKCCAPNNQEKECIIHFAPIISDKICSNEKTLIIDNSFINIKGDENVISTGPPKAYNEKKTMEKCKKRNQTKACKCKNCLANTCTHLETILKNICNKYRKLCFDCLKNGSTISSKFCNTSGKTSESNKTPSLHKSMKLDLPNKKMEFGICEKEDICYVEEINKFISSIEKKNKESSDSFFSKNCDIISFFRAACAPFKKNKKIKDSKSFNHATCSKRKITENRIETLLHFVSKINRDFELKEENTHHLIKETKKITKLLKYVVFELKKIKGTGEIVFEKEKKTNKFHSLKNKKPKILQNMYSNFPKVMHENYDKNLLNTQQNFVDQNKEEREKGNDSKMQSTENISTNACSTKNREKRKKTKKEENKRKKKKEKVDKENINLVEIKSKIPNEDSKNYEIIETFIKKIEKVKKKNIFMHELKTLEERKKNKKNKKKLCKNVRFNNSNVDRLNSIEKKKNFRSDLKSKQKKSHASELLTWLEKKNVNESISILLLLQKCINALKIIYHFPQMQNTRGIEFRRYIHKACIIFKKYIILLNRVNNHYCALKNNNYLTKEEMVLLQELMNYCIHLMNKIDFEYKYFGRRVEKSIYKLDVLISRINTYPASFRNC